MALPSPSPSPSSDFGVPPEHRDWQDDAACHGADPDWFFPPDLKSTLHHHRMAKALCARCPVRWECLDTHLGEKTGIWGGTNEKERRRIRRLVARGSTLYIAVHRAAEEG